MAGWVRRVATFTATFMLFGIPSVAQEQYSAATAINFVWNAPAGSEDKVGTWLIREAEITQTGDAAYFAIIGNWTPPFYIGVQELSHRTGKTEKVALFSAWDTYGSESCSTCSPEYRNDKGNLTTIKSVGDGVVSGVFGHEGTGVNAFMNDFDWSVGDQIRTVVNLRPGIKGTEISAAIQKNSEPWRYFATFVYTKSYASLTSGYSFIEDFGGKPYVVRSAEFRSSWGESETLDRVTRLSFVGGQRNETTPQINPGHRIQQRSSTGIWGEIGSTAADLRQVWHRFPLDADNEALIPLEARIAALNLSGNSRSLYEISYRKHLEERTNLRAAEEAEAKLRAAMKSYGGLDDYAVYFDPDPSEASSFFSRNRFNYNIKQLRVIQSYPGTDYRVNGSYGETPGFMSGLQETVDGKRQVFLTVNNLDQNTCKLVKCRALTSPEDWKVSILESENVTSRIDYVTHTDLYSSAISWAPGDLITWLTVLSPELDSSLLSVAVRVGAGAWQHLATVRYPAIFEAGLAGGYAGAVEHSASNPFSPRVAQYSPTVLENFSGARSVLTNIYLLWAPGKNRHSFEVNDFGLVASVGIGPQTNTKTEYRLALKKGGELPQVEDGKKLLNNIVDRLSPAAKEYRESIEAKARAEIDRRATEEAAARAAAEAATNAKPKPSAPPSPKRYRDCSQLNKVYPGGVARTAKWKNKGSKLNRNPIVNQRVYDLNRGLDRDKDGLACERQ